jgi:hypothetical protein
VGSERGREVSTAYVCRHGHLERSCEICEMAQEIATLKRQVEVMLLAWKNSASCSACVLVRKESGKAAAANYCKSTMDCADSMRQWSLEQAKKGGG